MVFLSQINSGGLRVTDEEELPLHGLSLARPKS